VKYDGYRLRLERDGDRVRLITRDGSSPTWKSVCRRLVVKTSDMQRQISQTPVSEVPAETRICSNRFCPNLDEPVAIAPILDALRMSLTPLAVCGRQLTMHDTAEGFVISLADHGQIQNIQGHRPKIEHGI
jgi:hypothetical protein